MHWISPPLPRQEARLWQRNRTIGVSNTPHWEMASHMTALRDHKHICMHCHKPPNHLQCAFLNKFLIHLVMLMTMEHPQNPISELIEEMHGREVGTMEMPWQPFACSIHQNTLAVGSFIQDRENFISLYDISAMDAIEKICDLKHDFPPCQLEWSPSGLLASCSKMITVYGNSLETPLRLCNGMAVRFPLDRDDADRGNCPPMPVHPSRPFHGIPLKRPCWALLPSTPHAPCGMWRYLIHHQWPHLFHRVERSKHSSLHMTRRCLTFPLPIRHISLPLPEAMEAYGSSI